MKKTRRSLKAHLSRRDAKRSPISKLEKKVLHRIFDMLDPVDQACLALTCSGYLYLLMKVKNILVWGTDIGEHTIRPTVLISSNSTTREKLSCRLQNKRWLFCANCRRLHTRKAYKEQERARRAEELTRRQQERTRRAVEYRRRQQERTRRDREQRRREQELQRRQQPARRQQQSYGSSPTILGDPLLDTLLFVSLLDCM